jgi:hypothetical protein
MSRLMFPAALLVAAATPALAQQAGFASADSGPVSTAIFETKDAAVTTAGLQPLAKTDLRKGEREVRIWYSGFGNPQYLVIIRQNGENVSGKLMLFWDQYYESSPAAADKRVDNFVSKSYDCGPIAKRDSHFGEDRWISSICQANVKGSPDWKAFLAEVEAHALPQSTAADADAAEGENWGITVERRSGTVYGASHYRTALSIGAPEPGRGPKLQDMVQALAASARKTPVVAQH